MGFLPGRPLLDDLAVLVQDLDLRAFQLLAAVDVHLADLHRGLGVLHQNDIVLHVAGDAIHGTVLLDGELGVGGDGVAVGGHGLLQGVGLADLKASHHMGFIGGIPLGHDLAVLVENLDVRAFQLLAAVDVHLADLHGSQLVLELHGCAVLVGRRGDGAITVVLQGHLDGLGVGVVHHLGVVALHLADGVSERAVGHIRQRVVDLVEFDVAVLVVGGILDRLTVGILQHEAELAVLQGPANHFLHRGQLHIALGGIPVREHGQVVAVAVLDHGVQRTLAVIGDGHLHVVDVVVIGHAILEVFHGIGRDLLLDRVGEDLGGLAVHICQRVLQRLEGSGLALRHILPVDHGFAVVQLEGERLGAQRRVGRLGGLQRRGAVGLVLVLRRHGQVFRRLGLDHQRAFAVVLHLDGDLLGRGDVGDAAQVALGLGDGEHVGARLGERDLVEGRGLVLSVLADRHRLLFRQGRAILRVGLGVQRELEAVAGGPSAAGQGLGHADLRRHRSGGVGVAGSDGQSLSGSIHIQAALAVVLHLDGDLLRRAVVLDALVLAILRIGRHGLGDGELVGALLGEVDGTKGHGFATLLRVVDLDLRQRRAVNRVAGVSGQRELEAVLIRPVAAGELLGDAHLGVRRIHVVDVLRRHGQVFRRLGLDHQRAFAVVLHHDGDGLRRVVVGDAVLLRARRAVRHSLGDGELVGAGLGEGNGAEFDGLIILRRVVDHLRRQRRTVRRVGGVGSQRELEAVLIRPVAAGELLGGAHLGSDLGHSVGVDELRLGGIVGGNRVILLAAGRGLQGKAAGHVVLDFLDLVRRARGQLVDGQGIVALQLEAIDLAIRHGHARHVGVAAVGGGIAALQRHAIRSRQLHIEGELGVRVGRQSRVGKLDGLLDLQAADVPVVGELGGGDVGGAGHDLHPLAIRLNQRDALLLLSGGQVLGDGVLADIQAADDHIVAIHRRSNVVHRRALGTTVLNGDLDGLLDILVQFASALHGEAVLAVHHLRVGVDAVQGNALLDPQGALVALVGIHKRHSGNVRAGCGLDGALLAAGSHGGAVDGGGHAIAVHGDAFLGEGDVRADGQVLDGPGVGAGRRARAGITGSGELLGLLCPIDRVSRGDLEVARDRDIRASEHLGHLHAAQLLVDELRVSGAGVDVGVVRGIHLVDLQGAIPVVLQGDLDDRGAGVVLDVVLDVVDSIRRNLLFQLEVEGRGRIVAGLVLQEHIIEAEARHAVVHRRGLLAVQYDGIAGSQGIAVGVGHLLELDRVGAVRDSAVLDFLLRLEAQAALRFILVDEVEAGDVLGILREVFLLRAVDGLYFDGALQLGSFVGDGHRHVVYLRVDGPAVGVKRLLLDHIVVYVAVFIQIRIVGILDQIEAVVLSNVAGDLTHRLLLVRRSALRDGEIAADGIQLEGEYLVGLVRTSDALVAAEGHAGGFSVILVDDLLAVRAGGHCTGDVVLLRGKASGNIRLGDSVGRAHGQAIDDQLFAILQLDAFSGKAGDIDRFFRARHGALIALGQRLAFRRGQGHLDGERGRAVRRVLNRLGDLQVALLANVGVRERADGRGRVCAVIGLRGGHLARGAIRTVKLGRDIESCRNLVVGIAALGEDHLGADGQALDHPFIGVARGAVALRGVGGRQLVRGRHIANGVGYLEAVGQLLDAGEGLGHLHAAQLLVGERDVQIGGRVRGEGLGDGQFAGVVVGQGDLDPLLGVGGCIILDVLVHPIGIGQRIRHDLLQQEPVCILGIVLVLVLGEGHDIREHHRLLAAISVHSLGHGREAGDGRGAALALHLSQLDGEGMLAQVAVGEHLLRLEGYLAGGLIGVRERGFPLHSLGDGHFRRAALVGVVSRHFDFLHHALGAHGQILDDQVLALGELDAGDGVYLVGAFAGGRNRDGGIGIGVRIPRGIRLVQRRAGRRGQGDHEVEDLRIVLGADDSLADLQVAHELLVGHAAGEAALGHAGRQRDITGGDIAGQIGQDRDAAVPDGCIVRIVLAMLRCHGEQDGRLKALVVLRHAGLGEDVVAVVQALEGEGLAFIALGHSDLNSAAVLQDLLQLELSAGQSLVGVLVLLVDDHLVGEHDGVVPLGLALVAFLVVLGMAVLVQVAVVAVLQLGLVHVALAAQHGILVQGRGEQHLDCLAVQGLRQIGLADRLGVLVAVLLAFPGQLQAELPVTAPGQLIALRMVRGLRRDHRIAHLHGGDRLEGQSGLHLVLEGDVVLVVVGHVVRQRGGQPIGHVVADVVVGAVLPVAVSLVGGIVDVLDLLLEGGLLRLFVHHIGRQLSLVVIRGHCDHAIFIRAVQPGQDGFPRVGAFAGGDYAVGVVCVPSGLMRRRHGERDRLDTLVAVRHLRLGQDVVAVVQALEGEGVPSHSRGIGLGRRQRLAVRTHLLQLELSAGQGCRRVTLKLLQLVHFHLVGEGDGIVPLGILLVFVGRTILLQFPSIAVGQLGLVDVALAAQHGLLVQGRSEQDLDFCAVQAGVQLVTLSIPAFRLFLAPINAQGKGVLVGGNSKCILVRLKCLVPHLHGGDLLEGQTGLHHVLEGDVILVVVGHVVGQRGGQLVGHVIADVIVGAVLPVAGLARGIVGVLDLLLEGGLAHLLVGDSGGAVRGRVGGGIAGHIQLLHPVRNIRRRFIGRLRGQILEGIAGLLCVQVIGLARNIIVGLATVRALLQLDRDLFNAIGPGSSLAVGIQPLLLHRQAGFLRAFLIMVRRADRHQLVIAVERDRNRRDLHAVKHIVGNGGLRRLGHGIGAQRQVLGGLSLAGLHLQRLADAGIVNIGDGERERRVRRDAPLRHAVHRFGHTDLADLAGVGHDRGHGIVFDRALFAGIGHHEVVQVGGILDHLIARAIGQAGDLLGLAVLELYGSLTLLVELNTVKGAGDRLTAHTGQRDGDAVALGLVRTDRALHDLLDRQADLLLGVVEFDQSTADGRVPSGGYADARRDRARRLAVVGGQELRVEHPLAGVGVIGHQALLIAGQFIIGDRRRQQGVAVGVIRLNDDLHQIAGAVQVVGGLVLAAVLKDPVIEGAHLFEVQGDELDQALVLALFGLVEGCAGLVLPAVAGGRILLIKLLHHEGKLLVSRLALNGLGAVEGDVGGDQVAALVGPHMGLGVAARMDLVADHGAVELTVLAQADLDLGVRRDDMAGGTAVHDHRRGVRGVVDQGQAFGVLVVAVLRRVGVLGRDRLFVAGLQIDRGDIDSVVAQQSDNGTCRLTPGDALGALDDDGNAVHGAVDLDALARGDFDHLAAPLEESAVAIDHRLRKRLDLLGLRDGLHHPGLADDIVAQALPIDDVVVDDRIAVVVVAALRAIDVAAEDRVVAADVEVEIPAFTLDALADDLDGRILHIAADDGGHGGRHAAADVVIHAEQVAANQDAADGVVAVQVVAGAVAGLLLAGIVVRAHRDDVVVVQQGVEGIHVDGVGILLQMDDVGDDVRVLCLVEDAVRVGIPFGRVALGDVGIADDLMGLHGTVQRDGRRVVHAIGGHRGPRGIRQQLRDHTLLLALDLGVRNQHRRSILIEVPAEAVRLHQIGRRAAWHGRHLGIADTGGVGIGDLHPHVDVVALGELQGLVAAVDLHLVHGGIGHLQGDRAGLGGLGIALVLLIDVVVAAIGHEGVAVVVADGDLGGILKLLLILGLVVLIRRMADLDRVHIPSGGLRGGIVHAVHAVHLDGVDAVTGGNGQHGIDRIRAVLHHLHQGIAVLGDRLGLLPADNRAGNDGIHGVLVVNELQVDGVDVLLLQFEDILCRSRVTRIGHAL